MKVLSLEEFDAKAWDGQGSHPAIREHKKYNDFGKVVPSDEGTFEANFTTKVVKPGDFVISNAAGTPVEVCSPAEFPKRYAEVGKKKAAKEES